MTPFPVSHLHFDPKVDDDSGEWWFRVAVSTAQIRPAQLPAPGTLYKEAGLRAVNARMDEWGDYKLMKYANGPDGYVWAHFGKVKTEEELRVPYKEKSKSKHYDWPTVVHAIAFADDSEFPVTETRPGGRTVKIPRKRARLIKTNTAFALCKWVTRYYLGPDQFNIPTHPQPTENEITWVTNDGEKSVVCLHPDLYLPARGQTWNVTEIQGDVTVVGNPSATRFFPGTPLETWQPFIIEDDQEELESGLFRRFQTTIYPPPSAELSSL